jgi:hypothetical protein
MFQCRKLPCLGWRSADFLQGFFAQNVCKTCAEISMSLTLLAWSAGRTPWMRAMLCTVSEFQANKSRSIKELKLGLSSGSRCHAYGAGVARWYICKPRVTILVTFGVSCNGRYWYIFRPFGIFYGTWYMLE